MRQFYSLLLFTFVGSHGLAQTPIIPSSNAPVVGAAEYVAADPGQGNWAVRLRMSKLVSELPGKRPAGENFGVELRPRVGQALLDLSVDCELLSKVSVKLCDQVFDLKGMKLSLEQISERLSSERPVLVSLDGFMPNRFYLELAKPDTLVVVLGSSSRAELSAKLADPHSDLTEVEQEVMGLLLRSTEIISSRDRGYLTAAFLHGDRYVNYLEESLRVKELRIKGLETELGLRLFSVELASHLDEIVVYRDGKVQGLEIGFALSHIRQAVVLDSACYFTYQSATSKGYLKLTASPGEPITITRQFVEYSKNAQKVPREQSSPEAKAVLMQIEQIIDHVEGVGTQRQ